MGQLGSLFRDNFWLLLKHIWYLVGKADIANDASQAAKEVSHLYSLIFFSYICRTKAQGASWPVQHVLCETQHVLCEMQHVLCEMRSARTCMQQVRCVQ
jgi:hypothetical protein